MSRHSIAALCAVACWLVATHAFAGSPERTLAPPALPGLSETEARALAFCEGFTDTALQHASDCAQMGRQLQALVSENAEFVRSIASMDSKPVRERCVFALELAMEPLMACSEAPEVEAALRQLASLEGQPPPPSAWVGPPNVDALLGRLTAYCDAFAEAVAAPADAATTRPGESDCDRLATRLTAVNQLYEGVFAAVSVEAERMSAAQRQALSASVAHCAEAMLRIPERCAQVPSVRKALDIGR